MPRPDAEFVAKQRSDQRAKDGVQDQKWWEELGPIDQRPSPEQLARLAPVLAEFEARNMTIATLPDGGIVYQAPQLTVESSPFLQDNHLYACLLRCALTHRDATQSALTLPLRRCLGLCCGFEERSILEDDEFWRQLLQDGPKSAACPDRLRGLWWMQDNIANEVLITFHDIDWMVPAPKGFAAGGVKIMQRNWSRDITCAGVALSCSSISCTREMAFFVSPNLKWIFLNRAWIYVPHENERLVAPVSGPVPVSFSPGEAVPLDPKWDMIRVSYQNPWDTSSYMDYNYRLRRVAWLDPSGELVKGPAWNELQAQILATAEKEGDSRTAVIQKMLRLGGQQLVKRAPR